MFINAADFSDFHFFFVSKERLLDHILERLRSHLEHILGQLPLDLDYLELISTQEFVFLNAISSHVAVSQPILDALTELHSLVNVEKEKSKQYYKTAI